MKGIYFYVRKIGKVYISLNKIENAKFFLLTPRVILISQEMKMRPAVSERVGTRTQVSRSPTLAFRFLGRGQDIEI